jgi:hypothetical protein
MMRCRQLLCVRVRSLGSSCQQVDKRTCFSSHVSAWGIQRKFFRVRPIRNIYVRTVSGEIDRVSAIVRPRGRIRDRCKSAPCRNGQADSDLHGQPFNSPTKRDVNRYERLEFSVGTASCVLIKFSAIAFPSFWYSQRKVQMTKLLGR